MRFTGPGASYDLERPHRDPAGLDEDLIDGVPVFSCARVHDDGGLRVDKKKIDIHVKADPAHANPPDDFVQQDDAGSGHAHDDDSDKSTWRSSWLRPHLMRASSSKDLVYLVPIPDPYPARPDPPDDFVKQEVGSDHTHDDESPAWRPWPRERFRGPGGPGRRASWSSSSDDDEHPARQLFLNPGVMPVTDAPNIIKNRFVGYGVYEGKILPSWAPMTGKIRVSWVDSKSEWKGWNKGFITDEYYTPEEFKKVLKKHEKVIKEEQAEAKQGPLCKRVRASDSTVSESPRAKRAAQRDLLRHGWPAIVSV